MGANLTIFGLAWRLKGLTESTDCGAICIISLLMQPFRRKRVPTCLI
jgi:hypothetical protein